MPKYNITKSIEIAASPQRVFECVADYGTWTTWSPWLIAEPTAKVTLSKPANAIGSTYAWVGDVTGEGILEHKRLEPGRLIVDELKFIKPFKSTNTTTFELKPTSKGTHLTWSMDSSMPWFLFWMIPMMKTFIGMDYSRGLSMLKDLIETGKINSKVIQHGVEKMSSLKMAGVARICKVEGVSSSMQEAFGEAQREFARLGLPTDKGTISVYTKFKIKQGEFHYISGFIIPENTTVPAGSSLKTWSMPTSKVYRIEHIGPYKHLGNGWSVANMQCRGKKLKQQKIGTFEIYRNSPDTTPDDEIKTDIYLPLKG
jgi:effector-binding domain-containing protein/uncharacterized protein YndB with AHSA1/START domain